MHAHTSRHACLRRASKITRASLLPSRRALAGLCLMVFALACAAQAVTPVAFYPEPPNYGLMHKDLTPAYDAALRHALEQYHNCTRKDGCYASDLRNETALAVADLDRAVREHRGNKKLALVLDIDETALSNYPEIEASHFKYSPVVWGHWEDRAAAHPIPGTLALYHRAQALGVKVFFVTGRRASRRSVTIRDLHAAGYTRWAGLFLRPDNDHRHSVVPYKASARAKIAAEGYIVLENVGDQFSDLEGSPAAEYSIKLSDPFYYVP